MYFDEDMLLDIRLNILKSISISLVYFIFGVIIFYISYFGAKKRGTLINMGE